MTQALSLFLNFRQMIFSKSGFLFLLCFVSSSLFSQQTQPVNKIENNIYTITWKSPVKEFSYTLKDDSKEFHLSLPSFEIDGKKSLTILKNLKIISLDKLKNDS